MGIVTQPQKKSSNLLDPNLDQPRQVDNNDKQVIHHHSETTSCPTGPYGRAATSQKHHIQWYDRYIWYSYCKHNCTNYRTQQRNTFHKESYVIGPIIIFDILYDGRNFIV
jgi:hypothetical protein